MQPGDKLICIFINDYSTHDSFKEWPLHITIVPWFRIDKLDLLVDNLKESIKYKRHIKLTVGEERFFGSSKKLVNIIRHNKDLEKIERISRDLLKKLDVWIVDETTKSRRSFSPHITVQKNERTHMGDKLNINKIYIIEQKGNNKEIISSIDLYEKR